MPIFAESIYHFHAANLPEGTLGVLEFTGEERFSQPYRFDLLLAAESDDLDLDAILLNPATLRIDQQALFSAHGINPVEEGLQGVPDPVVHGIVTAIEQRQSFTGGTLYHATLRPRLWLLGLDRQFQTSLEKSIPEIITAELRDGGLEPGLDFEFKLEHWRGGPAGPADEWGFPRWEYVCQYDESSLDFIHRWMEHYGLYYWFEQGESSEKLIIGNSSVQHPDTEPGTLRYAQDSGLENGPAARSLTLRKQRSIQSVSLVDYNYASPDVWVTGDDKANDDGNGEWYLYGQNIRDDNEGAALATLRAEEAAWPTRQLLGVTNLPALRVGACCAFEQHDRQDDLFNARFLLTALRHEGAQPAANLQGLGAVNSPYESKPYYRNELTGIPAAVQYRQPRSTPRPRVRGVIHGIVDLDAIDDNGRYKIRLPFERHGGEGKSSCWCRLAKPYTGGTYGMHFPLHKGTEVILAFIDGDPDRPVIAGAMENPNTPSQTHDVNVGRLQLATGSYKTYQSGGGLALGTPQIAATFGGFGGLGGIGTGGDASASGTPSRDGERDRAPIPNAGAAAPVAAAPATAAGDVAFVVHGSVDSAAHGAAHGLEAQPVETSFQGFAAANGQRGPLLVKATSHCEAKSDFKISISPYEMEYVAVPSALHHAHDVYHQYDTGLSHQVGGTYTQQVGGHVRQHIAGQHIRIVGGGGEGATDDFDASQYAKAESGDPGASGYGAVLPDTATGSLFQGFADGDGGDGDGGGGDGADGDGGDGDGGDGGGGGGGEDEEGTTPDDPETKVAEYVHIKGAKEETVDGHETITVKGHEKKTIHGGAEEYVYENEFKTIFGGAEEIVLSTEQKLVAGWANDVVVGAESKFVFGGIFEMHLPSKWEITPTSTEIGEIKTDIKQMETSLHQAKTKIGQVATKVGQVETKVGQVDTKVGQVDTKVGQVATKVGQVETKVGQVDTKVGQVDTKVGQVDTKVGQVETKVGQVETAVGQVDTKLGDLTNHVANIHMKVADLQCNM